MLSKTTRRVVMTVAGVSVGAAAAAVATVTPSYAADPAPATPTLSAAQKAAFIQQLKAIAAGKTVTTNSSGASANAVAGGDCDTFGQLDFGGSHINLPAASGTGSPICALRNGDSSPGVTKLQDAFNKCYGQGLAQDGAYGPKTTQSTKNVQNFHGFAQPNGVYDWNLGQVMFWPVYSDADNTFLGCT